MSCIARELTVISFTAGLMVRLLVEWEAWPHLLQGVVQWVRRTDRPRRAAQGLFQQPVHPRPVYRQRVNRPPVFPRPVRCRPA